MPELHAPVRLLALTSEGPRPLPTPRDATDVHQLFDDFPLGIYEGFRTFGRTKLLYVERHFERAERSMEILGWNHPLDRDSLLRALAGACAQWPGPGEIRIRFDVLAEPLSRPGLESRVLLALSPNPGIPASALRDGVRVGVAAGKRRARPRIKLARWVLDRRGTGPGDDGFFEHLLLDGEGRILEGTSSNFFGVRDGVLLTAGSGVLEGLMRRIVLELAEGQGLCVRFEAVPFDAVETLDEAFLTSSTRAAVPIVEVAGRTVGSGRPGPILRRLAEAFVELAEREARPPLG